MGQRFAAAKAPRNVRLKGVALARVLFVCIGNSCRSQMAEGFARAYGADVMEARSAGIAPAAVVSPLTIQTMREKNIDVSKAWPKTLREAKTEGWDLIVNMSGERLAAKAVGPTEEWKVRDPIGESAEVFREVANQIEQLVMRLILNLRAGRGPHAI